MASLLRAAAMAKSHNEKNKIPDKIKSAPNTDEKSLLPWDVDKVVERNIVRFFGRTIPAVAIDVVRVDGKTMREQMRQDRVELLRSGKVRADPTYFGQLKKKYMAALTGHAVVAVLDDTELVPPGLITAVERARTLQRRERKREPIMHFLWQCSVALNQKSVLLLVDVMVETQQHNCIKQATLVQEIFAAFVRLKMLSTFEAELRQVLPILEESLLTIFKAESRLERGYAVDSFWTKYKPTAKLFLDEKMVDKVLAETENWSRCTPELSALATASNLGVEVFMPFCPEVVASHMNNYMRKEVENLDVVKHIATQVVNDIVAKIVAEADRLKMDRLVTPRSFDFDLFDHVVKLKTHTAVEQARHHIAARIKTLAVKSGKLAQMMIEKDVYPITVDPTLASLVIDADILNQYTSARVAVDNELAKMTLTSAEAVPDVMEAKRSLWWLRDPTFALEISYLHALAGKGGGELLIKQAINMLPADKDTPTYGIVIDRLRSLETSKAWLFSTPDSRGVVTALLQIVCNMQRGEGPSVYEFPAGAQMETAGKRLANFCVFTKPSASSTGQSENFFGKAALDMNMSVLETSVKDKTIGDLSMATTCQVFRWLLPEVEAAKLEQLSLEAYNIVLTRVSGKGSDHGGAMEVMVATAHSSKSAAEAKKIVVKSSPKPKSSKPTPAKKRKT